jgi:hypothetical protein
VAPPPAVNLVGSVVFAAGSVALLATVTSRTVREKITARA